MAYSRKNQVWQKRAKVSNLVLIALIVTAGGGYLVSINNLVVKGFALEEAKKKLAVLNDENRDLEIKRASLESYSDVNARLQKLQMVAVDKIDYLKVNPGNLAQK